MRTGAITRLAVGTRAPWRRDLRPNGTRPRNHRGSGRGFRRSGMPTRSTIADGAVPGQLEHGLRSTGRLVNVTRQLVAVEWNWEGAANATAVTASTRFAGPPLALRPFQGDTAPSAAKRVVHGRNRCSGHVWPGGRSTESTSRPGTALSSTGCASLSMASSCTFRGDIARQTTRRAASFDTWAAVSKTRALWSAFRGSVTSASGDGGAVSGQRAEWPRRRPGPGWGDGWAVIGDAATAAGRLIWGQAFGGVSISRVQPMLVDRSALSGIAGNCSGHPLRTRFVLADGVGTVPTLALSRAAVPFRAQWNVPAAPSWRAPVSISRGAGCGSRRPVG